MRLQDFMSQEVETVAMEDTVEAAWQKMKSNRIRHLVVLYGKTVIGVLSERDIINLNERERQGRHVQDVMEAHAVTANPDTTVREAANLMRGRTIGCLPVVEDGKLVGIVTTTDLLDLLGQGIERINPEIEKRPINRENPGRKRASSASRGKRT